MNLRLTSLAAIVAGLLGASYSQAGLVQWNIVTSASSISLSIPDQGVLLDGTNATVRIRNQTGSGNTWNVGNKANLQGSFDTQYTDGSSIQFLFGSDNITTINSGSYRPNPASFNAANTNTANPDGQFQNTSTAPGVYGAKIRASLGLLFDIAYMNIYNVTFNIGSPSLPMTGFPAVLQTFDPNGINNFGIQAATMALDGVTTLVGQFVPDTLTSVTNVYGANTNVGGLGTVTAPYFPNQPLVRRITIPIRATGTIILDGTPLQVTMTGEIVGETVPEPSTFMMAGVGLVALGHCAHRKRQRRKLL